MPTAKILEIPEKEGFSLMKRSRNNIDSLLEKITIEDQRMFLDGRKYEFVDKPAKTLKTQSKITASNPEADRPAEIDKENPENNTCENNS